MTVTGNRPFDRAVVYGQLADKPYRDPIQGEAINRAVVPMGRGFATWQRFHPGEQAIWVDDMEGRPRALTPKQYLVFEAVRSHFGGSPVTMRYLASQLSVSVSTISRAMVKLASWGLIAYIVGRGRYAAMLIVKRVSGDGLDRLREVAKAKVRAWSQATERRLLRVKINVATYFSYEEVRSHGYEHVYGDVMNATLKREWRDDEIVDIV